MKRNSLNKIMVLAGILLIISTAGAYSFGFGKSGGHHAANYEIPEGMSFGDYELADGTYEGTAEGFRPGLTVEVTVKNSEITAVSVVDHNEIGRQYYQRPISIIPAEIVDRQQTDVDVVSGASATSYGIMSAVEDAISKAGAQ